VTIGASFGAAFLADSASTSVMIEMWNPISHVVEPRGEYGTLRRSLRPLP
jgi:hypothetical protein